jgi:hypothetical protein
VANVWDVLNTAVGWLLDGQPHVAECLCRQILSADPNHSEAEFLLGRALGDQGRSDEAKDCFERAVWLRPVARWHVIQLAIAHRAARTYLEIGVDQGQNLAHIAAPLKFGVDPITPTGVVELEVRTGRTVYYQMTSDRFFSTVPQPLLSSGIDVAFIDGLHTYRQSLADVENCLKHLNVGGVILMHDCNPPSEAIATPAASFEDACAKNPAGWNGVWTGDVWRTILHLRSCRRDVRACVLDCDLGVGVICRGEAEQLLPYSPEAIRTMTYRDLAENRRELLGLRAPQKLLEFLAPRRRKAE